MRSTLPLRIEQPWQGRGYPWLGLVCPTQQRSGFANFGKSTSLARPAPLAPTTPPHTSAPCPPPDDAPSVSPAEDLSVTFDEVVKRGSGDITIGNLGIDSETVSPLSDSRISVPGSTLVIDPTADLTPATDYAILIEWRRPFQPKNRNENYGIHGFRGSSHSSATQLTRC